MWTCVGTHSTCGCMLVGSHASARQQCSFFAHHFSSPAMLKRVRQCANPAVREADYIQCIQGYVGRKALEEMLGPLVSDFHRLAPSSVIRCSRLLEMLIQKGVRNGVIFTSRVECAIKAVGISPASKSADLWAVEITEHVRLCFAMVRQMKLDEETIHGKSRSRKSAAFLKQCGAADLVVLGSLVDQIVLSSADVLLEHAYAPAMDAIEDNLSCGVMAEQQFTEKQSRPDSIPQVVPKPFMPCLKLDRLGKD